MQTQEYITFDVDDIIEALEDFYLKKTSEKIDLNFSDENKRLKSSLGSIVLRKTVGSKSAKFDRIPNVGITYPEVGENIVDSMWGKSALAEKEEFRKNLIN